MRTMVIRKPRQKTLVAILPIYLFSSCTAEFLKIPGLSAVLACLSFGGWLLWVTSENQRFMPALISHVWELLVCTILMVFFAMGSHSQQYIQINIKNMLFMIIIASIFFYYIEFDAQNQKSIILSFWLGDVIIASVYSIYRLQSHPELARYLATSDASKYTSENVRGIVSYAVIYGLALLIPVVLYRVKKAERRSGWLIFLTVMLVVMFHAQFALSIILGIMGASLFYLMGGITKHKEVYFRTFLVILGIMLLIRLDRILLFLMQLDAIPYELAARIREIYNFLYTTNSMLDTDMFSRFSLYSKSFRAIFSNVLLGRVLVGGGEIGGHSEILDTLANYGIFYFALLVSFFVRQARWIYKKLSPQSKRVYTICWMVFITFSLMNTSLWASTMVTLLGIIPLMLLDNRKGSANG